MSAASLMPPSSLETTSLISSSEPAYHSTTRNESGSPLVSTSATNSENPSGLFELPVDSLNKDPPEDSDVYKGPTRHRKAMLACLLSLALLTLHLCFLPRTSLSRDMRRWHGAHMPTATVSRKFLAFTVGEPHTPPNSAEQNMFRWMADFTRLNKLHSTNMIADGKSERTEYIKRSMAHLGYDTKLHYHRYASLPQPVSLNLTLLDAESLQPIRRMPLLEPGFETPAFVAHGINGSVNASYMHANTGSDEDYLLLESKGFNISGKIVIVKLPSIQTLFRKMSIAQLHGAVGFLYYHTGADDSLNSITERQEHSVSRGNAGFGPITNETIPELVSIPLSYSSARSLLLKVDSNSTNVFAQWDFSPIASGNNVILSMTALFSSPSIQHLTNVIGTLHGSTNEGTIIIAAKHDSLTTSDPLSGLSIMLEMMSAFQALKREGWKPLRTIKFISWDGSCSGSLGSQLEVAANLGVTENVVAYINIDGDAITGLKLNIDSSPLFNEILRETSQDVPVRFGSSTESNANIQEFDTLASSVTVSEFGTLEQYWSAQDNCSINNNLGVALLASNAQIFQSHLSIPSINIRFDNDANRDASVHIPNSNAYSLEWLSESNIDPGLSLHATAVRYLGLLAISLSEHEIPHYRIFDYVNYINTSFHQITTLHANRLESWKNSLVSTNLVAKSGLPKHAKGSRNSKKCTLSTLISQMFVFLNDLTERSRFADELNAQIQRSLYVDYAWYRFWNKWANYMHYKLANKKLALLERAFALDSQDFEALGIPTSYHNHLIYGLADNVHERTATSFSGLEEAIRQGDFALTTRWLIMIHNKLDAFNEIIS